VVGPWQRRQRSIVVLDCDASANLQADTQVSVKFFTSFDQHLKRASIFVMLPIVEHISKNLEQVTNKHA
uniref:hypothetical protein n=1 Tax=Klebsiella aerogenes TaxID=548 RepID=UPI001952BBD4